MNVILDWFTPARRKALYSITAGMNTIAVAVLPLLVSLSVIPASVADQITQVIGAVLAVFAGWVAYKNVPTPEVSE